MATREEKSNAMKVRRATLSDLPLLVEFVAEEAREAEGINKDLGTLEKGIRTALEDDSIAIYWVLVDEQDLPVGSVSAVREWSDWNAGYYWWIQSIYLSPGQRGKRRMSLLLDAVKSEMDRQQGLELRLYVHEENRRALKAYQKADFVRLPYQILVLRTGKP